MASTADDPLWLDRLPALCRLPSPDSAVQAGAGGIGPDLQADLDAPYSRVKEQKGRIDVLFVNAGGGTMLPLGSITEKQYDDTFGRNGSES